MLHAESRCDEEVLERSECFCDDLIISWNSCLAEVGSSDFELRLIEEVDICIGCHESGQYWDDLAKRDKRYIYRNNIICLSWSKGTDICILMGYDTLITADGWMELICANIDRCHP